jgi:5-methyltetrahydrofolate--homocysteine methyltransferase
MKEKLEKIKTLISEISDINELKEEVKTALNSGIKPIEIINILSESLDDIGKRYETGELFLSELIMAGVLATEVTNLIEKESKIERRRRFIGKIVIGTVKGDIHDIGKNIVIMMLNASEFDVIDLGVDVPSEKFAEAVMNEKPDVLGMSALLTSTMEEMERVIEDLKNHGLRDRVKILLGGRPVSKDFAEKIGADGYAKNAIETVQVVKDLIRS